MHEKEVFRLDLQLLAQVAKRFALSIAASEVSVLFEITHFKEQFRVHRSISLGYLVSLCSNFKYFSRIEYIVRGS